MGRLLEREDETSSSNGPKRRFYYFGLAPLAERTGAWGGSSYTWANDVFNTLAPGQLGQVVIQRTDASGSPVDKFLHYDHIGNVLSETTTAGAVSVTHEYDAYGRPVLSSASGGWAGNSLHITTKPYDAETGLFYFWQRWYDPKTGLFLSEAPMGRDKEHPYGFVENNGLSFHDVTGRDVDNGLAGNVAFLIELYFGMVDAAEMVSNFDSGRLKAQLHEQVAPFFEFLYRPREPAWEDVFNYDPDCTGARDWGFIFYERQSGQQYTQAMHPLMPGIVLQNACFQEGLDPCALAGRINVSLPMPSGAVEQLSPEEVCDMAQRCLDKMEPRQW